MSLSLVPAWGGGTRQERRPIARTARPVAKVPVCFVTKDHECAAHEPGHAIGVATCATAVNEVAQFVDWLDMAAERRRVIRQGFNTGGQIGQAVDTGTTRAGTL